MRDRSCSCGSGLSKRAAYDARGIFLTYVCDRCEGERLAGYRPEVLSDAAYEADEPIDGDGYDTSLEDANRDAL
jgi:hypothetical protein